MRNSCGGCVGLGAQPTWTSGFEQQRHRVHSVNEGSERLASAGTTTWWNGFWRSSMARCCCLTLVCEGSTTVAEALLDAGVGVDVQDERHGHTLAWTH
jgi:hypothetical protein